MAIEPLRERMSAIYSVVRFSTNRRDHFISLAILTPSDCIQYRQHSDHEHGRAGGFQLHDFMNLLSSAVDGGTTKNRRLPLLPRRPDHRAGGQARRPQDPQERADAAALPPRGRNRPPPALSRVSGGGGVGRLERGSLSQTSSSIVKTSFQYTQVTMNMGIAQARFSLLEKLTMFRRHQEARKTYKS